MIPEIQIDFDLGLEELNPIAAGEASCNPDNMHLNLSTRFNATVIHYIRKGKGTFCSRGEVYKLQAGQAFIIIPGETVSYYPDPKDPWEYAWVDFNGKLSTHFSSLPPVFTMPEGGFSSFHDIRNAPPSFPYLVVSDLFFLYAKLVKPQTHRPDLIRTITDHILQCYMQNISVDKFAKRFNLDRSYLSKKFKKQTGKSIYAYLTEVRLYHAKRLIYEGHNCKEASLMCGFNNTANFFKMFKKHYGYTPGEWLKGIKARLPQDPLPMPENAPFAADFPLDPPI